MYDLNLEIVQILYILWYIVFLWFWGLNMNNVGLKKLKNVQRTMQDDRRIQIANGHLNHSGDLKMRS